MLHFGFVILDSSFRGKYYGKKMLAFGIRHAFQDCGAKKVTLGVFANNTGAYHCYKSLGFRETGSARAYQTGNETWDCLELELPLWQKGTVRRPQAVPTIPRPETV